jgi:PAS domain S-box-containing protein
MGTPLRVLIVEDTADDAELLVRELRRGGFAPAYQRVDTAEAMSAALAQQMWDIVIADYTLPHFSAPAALALLQERGLDLPFIIVSGVIGEEAAVAALKAGARDFIMKGRLPRLIPAVQRELREAGERKGRRLAEQALRRSQAYLRAVMDNISDGLITASGQQTIQSINLAAQMLFGYMPAEVIGQDFKMLLAQPYRDQYEAHLRKYLETGEGQVVGFGAREVMGRHKDGTDFSLEMAVDEMRLDDQRLFICSVRDATQRRRTAHERVRLLKTGVSP